jgi:hypothetical protein
MKFFDLKIVIKGAGQPYRVSLFRAYQNLSRDLDKIMGWQVSDTGFCRHSLTANITEKTAILFFNSFWPQLHLDNGLANNYFLTKTMPVP